MSSIPSSVQTAYQGLINCPQNPVTPDLVRFADSKGLLKPKEVTFYLNTLNNPTLTPKQKVYQLDLNQRMLMALRHILGNTVLPSSAQVTPDEDEITTPPLPPKMLPLSEAKEWTDAAKEWEFSGIQILQTGELYDTCFCGYAPIRELYIITNRITKECITLGEKCVIKLSEDPQIDKDRFTVAKKACDSGKRLLRDEENFANSELIHLAYKQKIITDYDKNRYLDISKEKKLSKTKLKEKSTINKIIMYSLLLTEKGAYLNIVKYPYNTAGPKLLRKALEIGVIKQEEYRRYMKSWNHQHLSEEELEHRYKINQKIITDLKGLYKNKR